MTTGAINKIDKLIEEAFNLEKQTKKDMIRNLLGLTAAVGLVGGPMALGYSIYDNPNRNTLSDNIGAPVGGGINTVEDLLKSVESKIKGD